MAYERVEPWHEPAIDYWCSRLLAVMENSLELTRSRWIKDHKPTFHQPGDYMPDFLKPKQVTVVDLDEARQAAAQAAKTETPSPVPPPAILNAKWAALVAMRTKRAQATKARKQA